jgi:protoheme IX farnesyltransferase
MLPVVKGAAATRRAILAYSLVVAILALVPAATGLGGLLYLILAGVGGVVFVGLAFRLAASKAGDVPAGAGGLYDVKANARDARNLFAFSILYLFCLFAALLAERFAGLPPLVR